MTQSLTLSSMSNAATPNRPLKRRSTGDQGAGTPFFTPASDSFKPRPYLPHSSSSVTHRKPPACTPVHVGKPVHAIPPSDPSPADPSAVFLHPPFDVFPDSHFYPDGLTYSVMADNPEWFLDATDYISVTDDDPKRVAYPAVLEPPRGWCPVNKKDPKVKDVDGWPRNEEPRLRCTFCRRHYAGVNAKSMWRRHVYEKHKIAMSNRRDALDRAKGSRSSDKENKAMGFRNRVMSNARSFMAEEPRSLRLQGRANSMNSVSVTLDPTKPKYRSLLPAGSVVVPSTPTLSQDALPLNQAVHVHDCADSPISPVSIPRFAVPVLHPHLPAISTPPTPTRTVPPSPYDPTLSPEFRHTSPRRPSEQPWRFPSPSHPLHSSPEELCLGVVVGGIIGDGLESTYIPVMSSPLNPLDASIASLKTPISPWTPAKASPLSRKMITGRVLGLDRKRSVSDSDVRSGLTGVPKPAPRRLFYSGPLPVPTTDRVDFNSDGNSESSGIPPVEMTFLSKLETPFGAWFELRDDHADSDDLFTDTTILESPVARPQSNPRLHGRDPLWPKRPSGFGLGLDVSPPEVEYANNPVLIYPSLEISQKQSQAGVVADRELTDPLSSQEDLEDPELPGLSEDEDMFPLVTPPLKRRRTIDVLI